MAQHTDTRIPEYPLTEPPTTIIEPARGWSALQLGAIWEYRELLHFLVWRDLKVRNKQTLLGVAWAVLQPVVSMVVFGLLFGGLLGVPSGEVPYPIFFVCGAPALELLCWLAEPLVAEPGGQRAPDHQGILPPLDYPHPGGAVGPGGFRHRLPCLDCDDGV